MSDKSTIHEKGFHTRINQELIKNARFYLELYRSKTDKSLVEDFHLEVQSERVAELLPELKKPGSMILGDPVGTGKTAVTLTAIRLLFDENMLRFALIVAPSEKVKKLWETRAGFLPLPTAEYKRRARWKEGRLVIATRKQVPSSPSIAPAETLVVVDEAHRGLQNEDNKAYGEIGKVAAGTRLLLVTATPMQLSGDGLAKMIELSSSGDQDLNLHRLGDYGKAIANLLSAWRKYNDEKAMAVKKAISEACRARERAYEVLTRHLLSAFPREKMKIPKTPCLNKCLIKPGDWVTAYNVARIVPELVNVGKGDMFQRRLVSSCEAFRGGKAGKSFVKKCRESGFATDLHHLLKQLKQRLGKGVAHPKIMATVEWVSDRWKQGRHVLVFCIFHETQIALYEALKEKIGEKSVYKPDGDIPIDLLERFREEPNRHYTPLVIVVRDNMSESIDLDGGKPCVVHHDLPWNPMRLEQRYGRIVRISTGFKAVEADDVYVPVLDVEVDRRLSETVNGRSQMVDLFMPSYRIQSPADTETEEDPEWLLPDEIIIKLTNYNNDKNKKYLQSCKNS